jgi:hypothetical protein
MAFLLWNNCLSAVFPMLCENGPLRLKSRVNGTLKFLSVFYFDLNYHIKGITRLPVGCVTSLTLMLSRSCPIKYWPLPVYLTYWLMYGQFSVVVTVLYWTYEYWVSEFRPFSNIRNRTCVRKNVIVLSGEYVAWCTYAMESIGMGYLLWCCVVVMNISMCWRNCLLPFSG